MGKGNQRMESKMRIVFFLFMLACTQTAFAAGQTVAVLPSEGSLKDEELIFLTNKAQEIAVRVLPQNSFEVFPQEIIIKRLGGANNYVKECKESSCIVDLGKKASVDYVAQCTFGKLGSDLTVTFELYRVRTSALIDKFAETAKNTNGLLAIMEKKIPDSFMKISGVSSAGGETSGAKNDAEAYYKRGVVYYDKNDYYKAISEFTEAIRLNPNYAEAYYKRGAAYGKKGDYDIAMSDFNDAIRLNPNYAEAYTGRCVAYTEKGDLNKAISDCNQAIRLNPKLAKTYYYYNRGNAYSKKGDYDRAISDYNEAIRLKPNFAGAYYNRGVTYGKKGDYDKAIADYESALRIDPNYSDAKNALANLKWRKP